MSVLLGVGQGRSVLSVQFAQEIRGANQRHVFIQCLRPHGSWAECRLHAGVHTGICRPLDTDETIIQHMQD